MDHRQIQEAPCSTLPVEGISELFAHISQGKKLTLFDLLEQVAALRVNVWGDVVVDLSDPCK